MKFIQQQKKYVKNRCLCITCPW